MPAQPLSASLASCTNLRRHADTIASNTHSTEVTRNRGMPPAGRKRLRGHATGRLVGVAGAQGGSGLPLVADKGMASMFEAAGRVAQPPEPDEHRRAVPQGGTANNEARTHAPSAAPRAAPTKCTRLRKPSDNKHRHCKQSTKKKPPKACTPAAFIQTITQPGQARQPDQFFDWSTSLFLAIQGIMARSSAPTVSIGCTAFRRRRAVMLG